MQPNVWYIVTPHYFKKDFIMPHIHTNPGEHDHTVCIYVVRTDTPEPLCLLHMHRKLGKLLPAGGHIETHETPWQTVAHELEEETGYELSKLRILQPAARINSLSECVVHPLPVVVQTHSYPILNHHHTDSSYALVASGPPLKPPSQDESQDIRWLSRNDLALLSPDEIYENNREVYLFILDHCLSEWEQISTQEFTL